MSSPPPYAATPCPVCGKRFHPDVIRRHVGIKHPRYDLRKLDAPKP